MIGSKICKFYIDYFVVALFVYGLGDYLFLRETYKNNIWSLINLITFGALIFIPYIKLLNRDYLNINKSDFHKKEYKDCLEFNQDYERVNPINKKEGKINYLKKLKEKQLINENEFNNYIKDIYNINIMQIYYKNKDTMKDTIKIIINEEKKEINNNNSIKDASISENVNININNNKKISNNKKIGKKKSKPLISKPLTLNQVNSFNSNSKDIYNNNFGDSVNQNYDEI